MATWTWLRKTKRGPYNARLRAAMHHKSGVYAIRDKNTREVLYVGESHQANASGGRWRGRRVKRPQPAREGRAWKTLLRHFQDPGGTYAKARRQFDLRGMSEEAQRRAGDFGALGEWTSREPERMEILFERTTPGKAISREAEMIRRLRPRDNVIGNENENDDDTSFDFGANVNPRGAACANCGHVASSHDLTFAEPARWPKIGPPCRSCSCPRFRLRRAADAAHLGERLRPFLLAELDAENPRAPADEWTAHEEARTAARSRRDAAGSTIDLDDWIALEAGEQLGDDKPNPRRRACDECLCTHLRSHVERSARRRRENLRALLSTMARINPRPPTPGQLAFTWDPAHPPTPTQAIGERGPATRAEQTQRREAWAARVPLAAAPPPDWQPHRSWSRRARAWESQEDLAAAIPDFLAVNDPRIKEITDRRRADAAALAAAATPQPTPIEGPDPATMTPAEINRELDRLGRLSQKITDEMIQAGRGHETAEKTHDRRHLLFSEIRARVGPGHTGRMPAGFKRRETPETQNPKRAGRAPIDLRLEAGALARTLYGALAVVKQEGPAHRGAPTRISVYTRPTDELPAFTLPPTSPAGAAWRSMLEALQTQRAALATEAT